MKLIAACDGRELAGFLATLAHTIPLQNADVIFAYIIDSAFAQGWPEMARHHWLGRLPASRERARFHEAATTSAQEILNDAMTMSRDWPLATRRSVQTVGNPERELVRLALAEHADLLAIGQHRQELGPKAIGKCARFVIDHAPCSVLLVRGEPIRAAAADLLDKRLKEPKASRTPHPKGG